jgi:hypothetical protein
MRSVRSAGAALTLAGIATIAGTAMPAFAAGPVVDVTPSMAVPGQSVAFGISCVKSDGKDAATSATLFGTTLGLSEHIPMSASTHKGVFVTVVKLPAWIKAGAYSPSIDCSNGMSTTATVWVKAWTVKPAVIVPAGAPVTGDGITSTAVGGPLTAAGLGLLGVSSIIGAFALRRRSAKSSRTSASK